jgi:hypothetical protein
VVVTIVATVVVAIIDLTTIWLNLDKIFPQPLPFRKTSMEEFMCEKCVFKTRRVDSVLSHFMKEHSEDVAIVKRITQAYLDKTGKKRIGCFSYEDLD